MYDMTTNMGYNYNCQCVQMGYNVTVDQIIAYNLLRLFFFMSTTLGFFPTPR